MISVLSAYAWFPSGRACGGGGRLAILDYLINQADQQQVFLSHGVIAVDDPTSVTPTQAVYARMGLGFMSLRGSSRFMRRLLSILTLYLK
jgi:hypothetical protein